MTDDILATARQHLLHGWTFEQWSIACGRYGVSDFQHQGEVDNLRARWDREQPTEPGEVSLAGVILETQPYAAMRAFELHGRVPQQS